MEYINVQYDPLNFLRDVFWASKEHYDIANGKHSHRDYLVKCNEHLDKYFETNLKDRYVYSLISFKSEINKDLYADSGLIGANVDYNFNENVTDEQFKWFVKELFQDAKSGEVINLTQLLLTKQDSHDFYLFSSESCKGKMPFWENDLDKGFDLSSLIWNDDKSKFYTENQSNIEIFRSELDTENFFEDEPILKFSNYLWHYKRVEIQYLKFKSNGAFYVHFIRPSINEYDYNILLSLVTNEPLTRLEFSDINYFLYRILSNTVIEKIKESERLKTIESINMSTHLLKTHISEAILSEFDILNERKELYDISFDTSLLENNCKNLFTLTGILNLLTKINDINLLIKSGVKDNLFTSTLTSFNLESKLLEYNQRIKIKRNGHIVPRFKTKQKEITISIANNYITEIVYNALLYTICENLIQHGKRNEKQEVVLDIAINSDDFIFSNESKEYFEGDETKMSGNLHLFKKLIERTNSGTFIVTYPTIDKRSKSFSIQYKKNAK